MIRQRKEKKIYYRKPKVCEMQVIVYPEKTADISRPYHQFSREMTSEKQVQKFHADDASLARSG